MSNETYEMLESAVQVQLKNIDNLDTESKEGKDALAKAIHLAELLITSDKDNVDYYDKQERRRIEEDRNKAMADIEHDKQKVTWGRASFEMAKVIVPLVIQIIAFGMLQKRMFKFEETGRVTSTGGREMHLPRFWK